MSRQYIQAIEVPKDCSLYHTLDRASFYDAYELQQSQTTPASALAIWLAQVRNTPRWVELLMRLRNRIVGWFGLKNLGDLSGISLDKKESDYRVGDRLGIFTIERIEYDELIVGDSDKHLDVKLSFMVKDAGQRLIITTVVHEHNWLGAVYMFFVRPMHRLIAPAVLRRFVFKSAS